MHGGEPVVDAAAQHAVDGVGLLGDLLVHVGVVGAHVVGLGGPLDGLRRAGGAGALGGVGAVVAGPKGGHLAVGEGHDLPGVRDQRGDVGGDEHLVLADAQHDGGAVAGHHDAVGEVGVQHGDAVGALDVSQRLADSLLQRVGLDARDEVGEDLGVGVGDERHALGGQPGPQVGGVVDDAVVDDGHLLGGVQVRVGVGVVRLAVGGPAGVRDSGGAGETLGDACLQVTHPALGLGRAQPARAGLDGDARGVVAAVLQALQPFEQEGGHVAFPDVSHDAAHVLLLCLPSVGRTRQP